MAIEMTSSDIFTPEQLTKHSKIYAGPGAGKTHFLVENVKNIVSTNPLITKSHAKKVLCITYTNAAVDEIKRRLDRYTDYVEAYTIHGFIIEHIIQPFQQDLRELMLSDFNITVGIKGSISSQVEGLGILHGIDKEEIYDFVRKTNPDKLGHDTFDYSKKAMGDIEVDNELFCSSITQNLLHDMKLRAPGEIAEQHVLPIKQYTWSVVKKLTHDEILYFGYRILESNPTALYATRVKFPFILVDEFQDTNPLQTILIKLIGQKSTVIGIVGDVAQSIYSFQGAKPSDFLNFSIKGDRELAEYVINGNRRSTATVVHFCNFLRQSDKVVVQTSTRQYKDKAEESLAESRKIHFLLGNTPAIQDVIQTVIKDGGVVLTRAWAAAFSYISSISEEQVKSLKSIYNSYYNSPIQLRDEIAEHNNVTWVRAFRFIFNLWESHVSSSFIDVIRALKLYVDIDAQKLTPKVIYQISKLSDKVFNRITEQSITTQVIDKFNAGIKEPEYSDLNNAFFEPEYKVPIFDEQDNPRLVDAVKSLTWDTSYKLFSEVFTDNSVYMTVHQAKGLEWEKVIVSVMPNKFDEANIQNLYSNPQLVNENPAEEFARMYYVACSRAKEDLYVHIPSGCNSSVIETAIEVFTNRTGQAINYDIL